jgi:hypothetical protein
VVGAVALKTTAFYFAALLGEYLAPATAARNYGIRFVLNVLVEESHSK